MAWHVLSGSRSDSVVQHRQMCLPQVRPCFLASALTLWGRETAFAGEGIVHPVCNVPGRCAMGGFGGRGRETVQCISGHRGGMLRLHWKLCCGGLVLACISQQCCWLALCRLSCAANRPSIHPGTAAVSGKELCYLVDALLLIVMGLTRTGAQTTCLKHAVMLCFLLERCDIRWGHQHHEAVHPCFPPFFNKGGEPTRFSNHHYYPCPTILTMHTW